jgi:hypothetical protein
MAAFFLLWVARQRLLAAISALFKTSAQLRLENRALRQQLAVLRRSAPKRLKGYFAGTVAPHTAKSHYIRSRIAFSVALGRIAATHLSSSGK